MERTSLHQNRVLWLALVFSAIGILGCGNDGGGDDSPDANVSSCELIGTGTDDLSLTGECDQAELLGTILLEALDDFSLLDAKVSNAVLPSSVREEEMSMGGCRLMRKRFPFCDPSCAADQACTFEGTCIPYPTRQDLGDICVAGLTEPYVMTAEAPDFGYFNTQLENPAFSGGERVEVRSSGGGYEPFALSGVGVSKMAGDDLWQIVEGNDLDVTWTTSELDAHASISVNINIDQHGSSPLLLECDFPDTGSASIPAALLDGLLTSGVSGFPVGKISRHTSDSVTVADGCIEFIVRSPKTVDVRVAGHTPCMNDMQCPPKTTCNLALQTCQ